MNDEKERQNSRETAGEESGKSSGQSTAEPVVLCGANAYEKKYYINDRFRKLPASIREELQIMCVLYTQDVGGILLLEFDADGNLQFRTEAAEHDYSYDEIGSVLKIKELRRTKEDLLRGVEMYYKLLVASEKRKQPENKGSI